MPNKPLSEIPKRKNIYKMPGSIQTSDMLYFWSYKDGNKWRLDTVAKTESEAKEDYRFCGGYKKVFMIGE